MDLVQALPTFCQITFLGKVADGGINIEVFSEAHVSHLKHQHVLQHSLHRRW
jgi:hypothetical protein